jgi:hypothetical protein
MARPRPLTVFAVSVRNLTFDTHQFAGRGMHPVHADFDGHDFNSHGISFQDYGSMHVEKHKLNSGRQAGAPDWVFNDSKLRAVIVGCIEARAYAGHLKNYKLTGTDADRLARALRRIAAAKPDLEARIDKLCRAFLDAKYSGRAADEKELTQKVEEVDTQLRMMDNPAKYYAGVAYHYWRCGLNSVETGQQLHIKPPHVRCLLWRMGKVAGQLGYGTPKTVKHRAGTKQSAQATGRAKAAALRRRSARQVSEAVTNCSVQALRRHPFCAEFSIANKQRKMYNPHHGRRTEARLADRSQYPRCKKTSRLRRWR